MLATLRRRPLAAPLFEAAGIRLAHTAPTFDTRKLTRWAIGLWRVSHDARLAIPVQRHLEAAGLVLPDEVDASVLRFHASMTFGDTKAPGMVWLLRGIVDDAPCGVLRIYLDANGREVGRRVLGRTFNAAIKLSADEDVLEGLHIAPSVESALKAMARGLRPVWVVLGGAAGFQLPGVEVTALENDGGGGGQTRGMVAT